MLARWLVASFVLLAACGTRSSAYSTGPRRARYEGAVAVSALPVTAGGASPVGVVEVTSVESLETAMQAFRDRVAEVGGNRGVVDRAWMTFELETRTRHVSYSCGTQSAPQTCTRIESYTEEIGYLHLVGRAFFHGESR